MAKPKTVKVSAASKAEAKSKAKANQMEEDQAAKYTSSSGVTTPQASDLSDSAFDYDVERNWSVIFSDDNFSTDHDIRSNYSSSSEEWNASTGRTSISGVVSETGGEAVPEAGSSKSPIKNKKKDTHISTLKTHNEEVGDSVTTLKGPGSTEGSFTFPDPIKVEKMNLEQKKTANAEPTVVDKLKSNVQLGQISKVLLAVVLLLAVEAGRGLMSEGGNVFPPGIFHTAKPSEETINTLTIIRYSTKTETQFVPGETVYVETTTPYEAVIPASEYNDEDLVHRKDSLDLINDLFSNWKDDGGNAWNYLWTQTDQAIEKAAKNANSIYQQTKNHDYQGSFDKVSSKAKSLWEDSFEPTSDYLISKMTDLEDKAKMTYYQAVYDITSFDYKGNFDTVKEFYKDAWNDAKDQSSKVYTAVDSAGYFDFLKKDGRDKIYDELSSSLKGVNDVVGSSTSKVWDLFKDHYESFNKPEGTADQLKSSLSTAFESLKDTYYKSEKNANSYLQTAEKTLTPTKGFLKKFQQSKNFKRASFASKHHASKLKGHYSKWIKPSAPSWSSNSWFKR